MLVPDRNKYIEMFKQEFSHINNNKNIIEIAIMSLSKDWQVDTEYHFDLGVHLTTLVVKSFVKRDW
jgi:hypothetical protein